MLEDEITVRVFADRVMEGKKTQELRRNKACTSKQEPQSSLSSNTGAIGDDEQTVSKKTKKDNRLLRFCRRRIRSGKQRGLAYRPMVESIDEDVEAEHFKSSSHKNASLTKPNSSLKKSEKKRRIRMKEKSTTFDYADLKNEIDFPPRINIRRTAICAKSKSADALQLETFIVVSRLKQFDLI